MDAQRIIINNENYKRLPSILSDHKKNGVRQVRLVYREGKSVPPVHLAAPYIKRAKEYAKKNRIKILPNEHVFKKDIDLDHAAAKCVYENKGHRCVDDTVDESTDASIIILTHDRKKYLLKVLDSLSVQETDKRFEVIIVDDGSTDDTLDAVKGVQCRFALSYIYWSRKDDELFGKNRAGPARNIGAKHAKGKILIFIDGDIVLSPQFVSEHVCSHVKDTAAVVIGPSIREREKVDVRERYFMLCDDDIKKLPVPWAMLHSGNFSVRKKDFWKIGGFSDDFVYWGMEDDELGYRFVKAGYDIILNRKAYGTHLWHPPEYIDEKKKRYGDMKNAEVFYKKHLDIAIYDYHLTKLSKKAKTGYLSLRLTDRCNNNCGFCEFLGQKRKHLSSMAEITDTISYAKENNMRIVLTGGEPTLSKDFSMILMMLEDVDAEIVTNGRAFSYPAFAKKTASYVRNYLISVFGPENIHDRITKVKGSFRQTMRGIDNLLSSKANVAVHLVINGTNHSYFEETVSMLKKKGITDFHLSVVPPGVDPSGFSQERFSEFVKHALTLDMKLRNDFFDCLKTKKEQHMDTMDMKRCLHCYFVDGCRGRPDLLDTHGNGRKTIFFRDDDVTELTPKLKKLIDLFIRYRIPLVLAVIPEQVTNETVKFLKTMKAKHHGLLEITQHGLSHAKNNRSAEPYEFGRALSYKVQLDKIKRGKRIMERLFGDDFLPVFVPPYNSFDKNTMKALKSLRFLGLSADVSVIGLHDLSTNIDLVSSYHPLRFYREQELLRAYRSKRRAGFLIHHELLDDEHFAMLEDLMAKMRDDTALNFSQIMNPKVLLIEPKFPQDSALVCEPTGLLSLAGSLRQKHEVRILDMNLSADYEKIMQDLKPKYVGLSAVTPQAPNAYKISRQIKEKYPETMVIFGGVHPTFLPEEALDKGLADYVVIGEGERSMQELISSLESGRSPDGIKGIAYKKDGKLHMTENEFICDLDTLPFPAYDLVPIGLYRTSECMIPGTEKKAIHLLTSRGCPNNCNYCASPLLYKRRVRFRSVGSVIEELRYIIGSLGIRWVHFHDDNLLVDQKRITELCDKILKNKLKFEWTCLANVDTVVAHPEILDLMKDAGCIGVEIGVETGDPDVFSHISKEQNISQIKKAARYIRQAGLYAEYLMIAYNIGETIESPFRSMRLLYEINFRDAHPDTVTSKALKEIPDFDTDKMILMGHLARASPGSLFFTQAKDKGMVLTKTWDDHFEENIGFLPNSFLDDRIRILKKTEDVPGYIRSHEKLVRFCIDNCFYTSNHVLKGLGSLDELFLFMQKIYQRYDDGSPRDVIDDLGRPKIVASAISILSILRLIGGQGS